MEKPVVSVVKSDNVVEQVEKAIELIGGISKYVKPEHSVLIKPSLVTNKHFSTGVTTNPAVIEGIVILLKKIGVKSIYIGDGCAAIHIGTIQIMNNHGIGEVARKYGCEMVDLNIGKKVILDVPKPYVLEKCEVAQLPLEVDRIINVGQMKCHFITGVSLSLKNMKRCVPPKQKRLMHDVGVHNALVDMHQVIHPHLSIIDGTVGHEGMGPAEGSPVGMKTVIAGSDSVAVDTVACNLMGINPDEIPHIKMAGEIGLGEGDINNIIIKGTPLEEVKRNFKRAEASLEEVERNIKVYNGSPCSGCIGSISISSHRMLDGGIIDKIKAQGKSIAYVLGPKPVEITNSENEVLFVIGNCAKRYVEQGVFVPGCAPAAIDLINTVTKEFDIEFNPI